MKTVSDSGTCIQEFKRCASTAGMGFASVVGLHRTWSNGFVYVVLQENCRVAFKDPTFLIIQTLWALKVPAGVPWVISTDQVRGLNDQNCLAEPGFHDAERLMPSPSPLSLHYVVLLQDLSWHRWPSVNWSQRISISVLHMGRVRLAPQLCQSLSCVMNWLPRSIPSDWLPVLHKGRKAGGGDSMVEYSCPCSWMIPASTPSMRFCRTHWFWHSVHTFMTGSLWGGEQLSALWRGQKWNIWYGHIGSGLLLPLVSSGNLVLWGMH